MNVAAYQEKENGKTTSKREAEEERIQATDLKEAACCPCGHSGGSTAKKSFVRGECLG